MGRRLENEKATMTDCHMCKGTVEEKTVTRVQQYKGRWYLLENLPALVCRQCGETYYTPQTHDTILELLRSDPAPLREETMIVVDARGAA
jgi:YgiT-type zinc finger domain-containing protein